jgi:hypothetical protein
MKTIAKNLKQVVNGAVTAINIARAIWWVWAVLNGDDNDWFDPPVM